MPTERIIIEISESGARVVSRQVDKVGRSAKKADTSVKFLQRSLRLLGSAFILRQIAALSDEFVNLQNKLRITTKDEADLARITEDLLKLSNDTRTSFAGTATFYAKLALSAKALGTSEKDLITVTKGVNQAIILSGVNAREATDGLIQFSQAIASNRLGGDELRSVLEQLPFVADIISKQLGVTRGEMRKLGQEGKITADVIIDAFKNAADDVESKFGKTVPTIGQAFIVLKNNVVAAIGELNKSTGIFTTISRIILFVANNVDFLVKAVKVLVIAFGPTLLLGAIFKVIKALNTLKLAALANPFTAILVIITGLVAIMVQFGDEIKISQEGLATWSDFAVVSLQVIWDSIKLVSDAVVAFFNTINIDGVSSFDGLGSVVLLVLDKIAGTFVGLSNVVSAIMDNISGTWELAWKGLVTFLVDAFSGAINLIIKGINKLIDALNDAADFIPLVEGGLKRLREVDFAEGLDFLELSDNAKKAGADIGQAFQDGWNTQVVTEGFNILKDLAEQRAVSRQKEAAFQKAQRDAAALAAGETGASGVLSPKAIELLKSIEGPMTTYTESVAALNELLKAGKIDQEQYAEAMLNTRIALLETDESAFAGIERGFLKVQKSFSDFATQTEDIVTSAFDGMADALTDLVTKGKADFKGLAQSIVADITKMIIKQLIFKAISSGALGGGGGAAVTAAGSATNTTGRAEGGSVTAGVPVFVGERGRKELFVPQTNGRIINDKELTQEAAAPIINIINNPEEGEVGNFMESEEGQRIIMNTLSQNKQNARKALGT